MPTDAFNKEKYKSVAPHVEVRRKKQLGKYGKRAKETPFFLFRSFCCSVVVVVVVVVFAFCFTPLSTN